jgi:phosphate transport system substrate-binding protein
MKRIAAILLVTFGVATFFVARAALSITGAGATFPYPMYSKWFEEYHKKDSSIEINYQSIGSGGGIHRGFRRYGRPHERRTAKSFSR